MFEKITIDMLTENSVSVKKQSYINVQGSVHPAGQPWRRAYVNSNKDRELILQELPQEQQNAIFAVWGDTPTVAD